MDLKNRIGIDLSSKIRLEEGIAWAAKNGVSYIDSSGIGELVSGFTTVTNQGGQLKLLGLTKRVQDLLQITKLYTVFDVHEEEAHAIRSFS